MLVPNPFVYSWGCSSALGCQPDTWNPSIRSLELCKTWLSLHDRFSFKAMKSEWNCKILSLCYFSWTSTCGIWGLDPVAAADATLAMFCSTGVWSTLVSLSHKPCLRLVSLMGIFYNILCIFWKHLVRFLWLIGCLILGYAPICFCQWDARCNMTESPAAVALFWDSCHFRP